MFEKLFTFAKLILHFDFSFEKQWIHQETRQTSFLCLFVNFLYYSSFLDTLLSFFLSLKRNARKDLMIFTLEFEHIQLLLTQKHKPRRVCSFKTLQHILTDETYISICTYEADFLIWFLKDSIVLEFDCFVSLNLWIIKLDSSQ